MKVKYLLPFLFFLMMGCSAVEYLFVEKVYEAPPSELTEFTAEFQPKVIWENKAGDGAGETGNELAAWYQDGKLFAVDIEGDVSAFNAETGRRLWQTSLNMPVVTGAGGGLNMVLIGTKDANVIALSPENGNELWRSKLSSEVLAPPSAAEGIAVARTADGRVSGLSAETGEVLWSYQRAVPLLSLRGAGAPVIYEGRVVVGYDNGKLVVLSIIDGSLIWERSIAVPGGRTELDRLVDIDADPVIINQTVYVVAYQGNLASVDLASGQLYWGREMSSQLGLSVVPWEAVYVTDDEGNVWAVQDGTGDALWRQTRLLRRKVTGPAVAGNYVVVGDFEGYLHWIARNDGRFVARQKIADSAIVSKPVVRDGKLYVTAADGTVAAVLVP